MQKIIKYIITTIFILFSSFLYALEVGDVVSNTALVNYTFHESPIEVNSNTVEATIEATEAKISLLYPVKTGSETAVLGASAYLDENGVWQESEMAILDNGMVLGNGSLLNFEDTDFYRPEDTVIIRVSDADQNVDRDVRDVIEVNITSNNGDIETLQLIETTKNSGVFVAYIVLSNKEGNFYDNHLFATVNETITVDYDDNMEEVKSDSAVVLTKKDYKVWMEKKVNKTEASIGELLQYTLMLHNDEEVDITNFLITDALPLGLKYEEGTATYAKQKVDPTFSDDGRSMEFIAPRVEAKSQVEVSFIVSVTAGVEQGKVSNKTWVTKSTVFKSNIATVTTNIKEELMRSSGIIVGQIYNEKNRKLGIAGVRLYLENGMYVVSDEHGKYHFSGIDAGRHIVQVDKALLPKGYEMGSCQENVRRGAKNFSELLNLGRGALKRVDFCLKRNKERVEKKKEKEFIAPTKVETMPSYGLEELNSNETRAILWPPKAYVPSIPSTRIAIKHPKSERVDIWLNGYRVSKINYDGKVSSKKSTNIIDLYKGVDLLGRTNTIKVEYFSKSGELLQTLSRKIHISSVPVQVKYLKKNSRTIADGTNSPVIAVQFLDDMGKPLRSGMTGTFTLESPYVSQNLLEQLQNNPLATRDQESRYTIDSDGIAYIKLQPTTESGEVILHFQLQKRDKVVRAWLKPELREWIMVGFAEGTVGYNTLKGNIKSLDEIGAKEKIITEGRISFFAKGKIKGDWLLSMAYDTGKESSNTQFFDEIDPNAYYTLYNDNSVQNQEAPSRKKLYVKLEKEQFNLLFGDYSTDLSYTELSSYSRRFTGVKSEYHGENVELKAFATNTEQLFLKDEIRGDGTSGYYYLKSKEIIQFSEKITIEVRNRYRTAEIVSTRSLQRFRDYDVDYSLGRLYFKEPIYSSDKNFNPRFIVVDYEINGDGSKHYTYGGRTAIKAMEGRVEVGATYISEDSGKKLSKLMGSDTTIQLGEATQLKAEYAKTKATEEALSSTGEAKLVEIEHVSNGIHARAYYREQEDAFGLGQLSTSLGATRKVGIDLSQQFDNRQSHRLSIYRDSDLLKSVDSDVVDFRTEFDNVEWSAFSGYRYSKVSSDEEMAQQFLFGGSYSLFDQRLRVSFLREQTISSNESELFPTKTTLGLDYALNASLDFFSAYEWTDELEQGRVGVKVRPWSGMTIENTTLSEFKNDNQNIYNTLGGVQSIQLSEKLGLNVGYEKGEIVSSTEGSVDDEKSSGLEKEFSAYRLGLNYNEKRYTATINGEVRKSDSLDKVNFSTAVYTQIKDSLALALSGSLNKEEGENQNRSDANVRFSLAYRPEEEGMIVLEKLDFISSKTKEQEEEFRTQKMVNNLNVNLMPTSKSEIALQHGFKYVTNTINDYENIGVTQLFGVDARYDVTNSWEFGLQGSLLYAQSANNMDYGFGLYSGHNLFNNMLLTFGYNWRGFEDRDFSLQTYRIEGPYFRFNMKFDQESLKETVRLMSW